MGNEDDEDANVKCKDDILYSILSKTFTQPLNLVISNKTHMLYNIVQEMMTRFFRTIVQMYKSIAL